MKGFTGKILHIDLSSGEFHRINSEKYQEYGGGHGMGAALFWDLCEDKTISDGRLPQNICSIMASPFCGTNVPSAGGRCEVTGVGVGLYPLSWFTRSNFGGHFSAILKQAGWDGIVLSGQASKPVWLDIQNDHVVLRDASNLWGKDTWTTQQLIRDNFAAAAEATAGWNLVPDKNQSGRTTQKPAVLAIGPAGENQTAHGCLIHGAGNAAGQGGFRAVWGSKKLKAISVLGTGSIEIADPAALLKARFTAKENMEGLSASEDCGEQVFWNAVTGDNISFDEGLERGRKLSNDGVERWKTIYYRLEGWDSNTGWPTRTTLNGLGLGHVADELEKAGRLGQEANNGV